MDRKLAAILFSDIAGFTQLTAGDEEKAVNLINHQRELFQPIVAEFDGEWLKEIGDGLLLSFTSSKKAINCAIKLQQKAKNTNDFNKKITIEIKGIGEHISIVIIDNGIGFGIFKGNIKDILNPYFTTKKNGTGLGLSIVNKIINDHNGKIDFIPINEGAKVEINFSLNDS